MGNDLHWDWEQTETFSEAWMESWEKEGSHVVGRGPAELLQWEGWHWGSEGRGQPHTHRLGGFDEHFAPPQLELVTVHVDRLQQVEDTLFLISFPRRPGGFGQNGISVRTIGERRIRLRLDWPTEAPGAAGMLAIHSPLFKGLGMTLDTCKSLLDLQCPFHSSESLPIWPFPC